MGLIGSAIGVAGSIFGGISAMKAMNNVKKGIESQREKNQNWFDRSYYADATQRADTQRVLTMTGERFKNRNRQASGTAAVMGGTTESVAASKAQNAQAFADATAQIATAAAANKDKIEATYMANDANYQQQLNDLEMQKAGEITKAVGGVQQAASNF